MSDTGPLVRWLLLLLLEILGEAVRIYIHEQTCTKCTKISCCRFRSVVRPLHCHINGSGFKSRKNNGSVIIQSVARKAGLDDILDNVFIRFGTKFYRQIVGIQSRTNCVPLVVDLFLFCYEIHFMKSLSRAIQADSTEAFNSTSRY